MHEDYLMFIFRSPFVHFSVMMEIRAIRLSIEKANLKNTDTEQPPMQHNLEIAYDYQFLNRFVWDLHNRYIYRLFQFFYLLNKLSKNFYFLQKKRRTAIQTVLLCQYVSELG